MLINIGNSLDQSYAVYLDYSLYINIDTFHGFFDILIICHSDGFIINNINRKLKNILMHITVRKNYYS